MNPPDPMAVPATEFCSRQGARHRALCLRPWASDPCDKLALRGHVIGMWSSQMKLLDCSSWASPRVNPAVRFPHASSAGFFV